jgi:hypothetical protein
MREEDVGELYEGEGERYGRDTPDTHRGQGKSVCEVCSVKCENGCQSKEGKELSRPGLKGRTSRGGRQRKEAAHGIGLDRTGIGLNGGMEKASSWHGRRERERDMGGAKKSQ